METMPLEILNRCYLKENNGTPSSGTNGECQLSRNL